VNSQKSLMKRYTIRAAVHDARAFYRLRLERSAHRETPETKTPDSQLPRRGELVLLGIDGTVIAREINLDSDVRNGADVSRSLAAIEDVYWRHRIWPNTNPGPKPALDAVMSQADIEKKVQDYLRNSQALERERAQQAFQPWKYHNEV
jgi:hypothetical protein